MNKQRLSILILSLIGASGTFLPWVSNPLMGSIYGTDGDGMITLFLYLIPAILILIKDRSIDLKGGLLYTCITSSVLASIIGIYDLINFKSLQTSEMKDVMEMNIGPGLYVIAIAGLLLPIFSIILKEKK